MTSKTVKTVSCSALLLALVLATPAVAGDAFRASSVNVDVRSSCSQTVKIKYDNLTASLSPNEVDRRSLDVGDEVTVLDDSERALGSVRISASTRELMVNSDCRSIDAR